MLNGSLELKSINFILKNHGIQPGGPVQKVIDSETMRYMGPYMPRRQAGELEHRHWLRTDRHSGTICPLFARRYIVRVSDDRQLLGKEK